MLALALLVYLAAGEPLLQGSPSQAAASVTAEELRFEGLAAFDRRDYAKAAELLRKATEANPRVQDGFLDLGRALHKLGKHEEAVAAFTRQIELTPFHGTAYGWRADALEQRQRWRAVEKDLSKQIEVVAPFTAWCYEKLGARRLRQERYAEAAELYACAATLEPKVASRWLDLAGAQVRAGRREEARRSLEQIVALDPPEWVKLKMARVYHSLGDLPAAGRLATEVIPSIASRFAKLTPDQLSAGNADWGSLLVEAWNFVGQGAAAGGDSEKAERYLEAAWRADFSAEAGWALGDLREKQGRLTEAVELWSMAAAVDDYAVPSDGQQRIEAACAKLPDVEAPPASASTAQATHELVSARPPRQRQAEARLTELRTLRLSGPGLTNLSAEILLLADTDGRVERVLNLSGTRPEAFDKQLSKLGAIRLEWPHPDEHRLKAIRGGLLNCSSESGCAIVLNVPRPPFPTDREGSIRIGSLDPTNGTSLRRGQLVALTATVRYELSLESGFVDLAVFDETGEWLAGAARAPLSRGAGEVTLTTTFTVPEDAVRIDLLPSLGSELLFGSAAGPRVTYEVR